MKSKNKLLMDRFHTISHRGLCNKQRMKSTFSDNSSNIKLKLTGEALEQTKTPLSPKFLKNTHLSKKLKMLIKNREIRKENYLSNQRFGSPIQTAIPQTSRYQSNYKPRNGYFMENPNETKKESSIMTQVKKERSLENLLFHRSGGTNINYKYGRTYNRCFPFTQNQENKAVEKLPSFTEYLKTRNFQAFNKDIIGVDMMETFDCLSKRYNRKETFLKNTQDTKICDPHIQKSINKFFTLPSTKQFNSYPPPPSHIKLKCTSFTKRSTQIYKMFDIKPHCEV